MDEAHSLPKPYRRPGGLEAYAVRLAEFLRATKWLWATHVVDFFNDELWEHFPADWLPPLRSLGVGLLCQLPAGYVQDSWPTSLKDFVCQARELSLLREPAVKEEVPTEASLELPQVMVQGMNIKKRHEVGVLASLVSQTARQTLADVVLDVGAGQGYLSQVLAFQYNLPVVAIDACPGHAEVTTSRSTAIAKYHAKRQSSVPQGPITLTERVDLSAAPEALHALVANLDLKSTEHGSTGTGKPPRVLLAGLHACGDLSASMIRGFKEWQDVVALVNVSCCYNLLSEEATHGACCSEHSLPTQTVTNPEPLSVLSALDKPESKACVACLAGGAEKRWGYPLSKVVARERLELGRHGRMLACRSAERWEDCSEAAAGELFMQHAFRAGLQTVLARYYPSDFAAKPAIGRHMRAWNRKKRRNAAKCSERRQERSEDFAEYAELALQQLGLPSQVSKDDLNALWLQLSEHAELAGAYWALRATLAGPLEALIYVDRLLYLASPHHRHRVDKEGNNVRLQPIFDPHLSPRNLALVAVRT